MKTTADWFIGELSGSELELTDDQKTVLAGQAEMFLRANGTLPWEKWVTLSVGSQTAFIEAGNRLRDEIAKNTAKYLFDLLEDDNGNGQADAPQ